MDRKNRLSVDHCLEVLNRYGKSYTPEQAEKIRDFLYTLVLIDTNCQTKQKYNETRH